MEVAVDTNVIIEASRLPGCWSSLLISNSVFTVESCVIEACTRPRDKNPPKIESSELRSQIKVVQVNDGMRQQLEHWLATNKCIDLDQGEYELVSWLMSETGKKIAIASADKAMVRACVCLGWRDRLVSLESLCTGWRSNPSSKMRQQYTNAWLQSFCGQLVLEEF